MRKSPLILAGILLAFSAPLHAQTVLGFHAGANIAELSGDVGDLDSRTGLSVGASVLFSLGETLGLYLAPTYSQRGASGSEEGVDISLNLDYLEIPVLLRYAFPSAGRASVHFYGGPAVSIEAKCAVKFSDGSASVSVDCDEGDFATKTFELGLMGGVGVGFELSEKADLALDLLYNLGLNSIIDEDGVDSLKHRVLTIRAGVAIPIG